MVIKPKQLEGTILQDDLLVSAVWKPPYMGGLFAITKGTNPVLRIVDRLSSSGLWQDYDLLTRSIYSNVHMIIYLYTASGTMSIGTDAYKGVHDARFQFGQLYVVSTGTNEVVQMDSTGQASYIWKFPGEGGSWHLNCMDLWDGRYVISCFGQKEHPSHYQGSWHEQGVIFDLESGKVLWSGLTKPHTPRMDEQGRQYICDSDTSRLLIREGDGAVSEIVFPGAFTRGLAFGKEHLYVGLSAIRHREMNELAPGSIPNGRIAVLDRKTFGQIGQIELPSAEIYDIVITSNTAEN